MNKNYIDVMDMAEAREARRKKQIDIVGNYKNPIISFTLNIPGPEKENAMFRKIHNCGISAIEKVLSESITYREFKNLKTGSEAYFSLSISAGEIKRKTIMIEDHHPLGRIFDIDVIDKNEISKTRREMYLSPRKCLLCNEDAVFCSRSRKHSVEELIEKITRMSEDYFLD